MFIDLFKDAYNNLKNLKNYKNSDKIYNESMDIYRKNEELGFFCLDVDIFTWFNQKALAKLKKDFSIHEPSYILGHKLYSNKFVLISKNISNFPFGFEEYIRIYKHYCEIKEEHEQYLKYFFYTDIAYCRSIHARAYNTALNLYLDYLSNNYIDPKGSGCKAFIFVKNYDFFGIRSIKVYVKYNMPSFKIPEEINDMISSYHGKETDEYFTYLNDDLRMFLIKKKRTLYCSYLKTITKGDYVFMYLFKILKEHGIHMYICSSSIKYHNIVYPKYIEKELTDLEYLENNNTILFSELSIDKVRNTPWEEMLLDSIE